MSVNLIDLAVQQYSANYELLLQRQQSKTSGRVDRANYIGKQASPINQFGAVDMTQVTGRLGTKVPVDASTDRRWVFPTPFDLTQYIDTFDAMKVIGDPKSAYVANAVAATNRRYDATVIAACFADAKTGESGSTTTSFGSTLTTSGGQNVAVATGAAAATGLNVAKMREVRRQAMANEIDLDMEQLVMYVTSKQHDNLLAEAQVISTDFNEKPVLVDGKITRFCGIEIVHYESLSNGTDDASGTSRMIPVFVKSGMHLGVWNEKAPSWRQASEIRGEPWELYHYLMLGATRTQEKKVFRVWCRE